MDEAGWTVGETAARVSCDRGTLSRVLNGRAGVSAKMALELKGIGWGTADHWMRKRSAADARWRDDRRRAALTPGKAADPQPTSGPANTECRSAGPQLARRGEPVEGRSRR